MEALERSGNHGRPEALPIPKPGVLFAGSPSGGTLMDLSANRYVALSRPSAVLWQQLVRGASRAELESALVNETGVEASRAEPVVRRQLELWQNAGLVIGAHQPRGELLPEAKVRPAGELRAPSRADVQNERLSVWLMARLTGAEILFRRLIRSRGLPAALLRLQRAQRPGGAAPQADVIIRRAVRAYHGLRRPFLQGWTAVDCLPRSMALAAVLREDGVEADLCFGVIEMPFRAHAWVEVGTLVLNEELPIVERYCLLGRF